MGLSIDKVYRFVQFVSNKESRGWIAPTEFNISAELAQITVYSRLEAYFLANKKIQNDMRPFLAYESMANAAPRAFPTDFRQLISCRVTSSEIPVPELTQAEYNDIIDSQFLAPSDAYPKCVVRNDGIHIYPVSVTAAVIAEYISKLSTTPTWNYTLPSGRPVYAATGGVEGDGISHDFEFEDNLFQEIGTYILMNVGINLNNEAVTQYGMAFNQSK